jgi:uncharacterized protein (TIGR02996 family)
MTDRQAFLRAIRESPDDDLPRLVYADWLEEHGEPGRASLFRVQVEVGPGKHGMASDRELELLTNASLLHEIAALPQDAWMLFPHRHCAAFEAQHKATGAILFCQMVRGFVEKVTCTAEAWRSFADALLAEHPIQWIGLHSVPGRRFPARIYDKQNRRKFRCDRWPGLQFEVL